VKAWGYVALVVAVIALLGGTYWLGYSRTPPVIEQTINEFTVLDSIPASVKIVNMVTPTGEPIQAEYATMDTTLVSPSGNSRVSLGVGYNEYSNLFNLKANFSETIPEINPVIKKSLIAPIASVGVGFADSLMLHDAELALGVEFAEKYSVSVFGRSDLTYGLRFGVRW
jgi:hypothetical protein